MKYGWQIAAALLGLVAIWEVWKAHAAANPAATTGVVGGLVGSTGQSYVAYTIAPGVQEVGSTNSTGGFTAAPDPSGIGGGFAT